MWTACAGGCRYSRRDRGRSPLHWAPPTRRSSSVLPEWAAPSRQHKQRETRAGAATGAAKGPDRAIGDLKARRIVCLTGKHRSMGGVVTLYRHLVPVTTTICCVSCHTSGLLRIARAGGALEPGGLKCLL